MLKRAARWQRMRRGAQTHDGPRRDHRGDARGDGRVRGAQRPTASTPIEIERARREQRGAGGAGGRVARGRWSSTGCGSRSCQVGARLAELPEYLVDLRSRQALGAAGGAPRAGRARHGVGPAWSARVHALHREVLTRGRPRRNAGPARALLGDIRRISSGPGRGGIYYRKISACTRNGTEARRGTRRGCPSPRRTNASGRWRRSRPRCSRRSGSGRRRSAAGPCTATRRRGGSSRRRTSGRRDRDEDQGPTRACRPLVALCPGLTGALKAGKLGNRRGIAWEPWESAWDLGEPWEAAWDRWGPLLNLSVRRPAKHSKSR